MVTSGLKLRFAGLDVGGRGIHLAPRLLLLRVLHIDAAELVVRLVFERRVTVLLLLHHR